MHPAVTKLVVLDRDGTLNQDRDDFVKSAPEWQPIPGALEAVARLNQAGWHTVVATNQSGLGRGLFDTAALNAMHLKMNQLLARVGGRIDAVFFCQHTPADACDCRKPQPGLLLQIAERFALKPADLVVVGDSLRDLQAAQAVGSQAHLVRTGKSEGLSHESEAGFVQKVPGLHVHDDLAAFAEFLIAAERQAAAGSGHAESAYGSFR